MKIQSAGRLGNVLFIWAFACYFSSVNNTKVSIFTDRFHSDVGEDAEETKDLLSEPTIRFYNSDLQGVILVALDWVFTKSFKFGNLLKVFFGVSDELDPITLRTRVLRGYFQKSDYVLSKSDTILEKLENAIHTIEQSSEKIGQIKAKYMKYQVVHIRLGDFVNSKSGIISPESYKSQIDNSIPTLVCTDGSREEILTMIDFDCEEIYTSADLRTWETLCLIQGASRFIGVNSTLSWWGAFLVKNNGNDAYLPDLWSKSGDYSYFDHLNFSGCRIYKAKFI